MNVKSMTWSCTGNR